MGRPEAAGSKPAHGTGEGVPYALPHPPPVPGGLSAAEPAPIPPEAVFMERCGIVHNQEGDYVSGYIEGVGRLVRSPVTLTTLQVGHTLFDQDGTFIFVNSLATLPEIE